MKIDAKDKKEKTMEMGDVKALREALVHAHQFLHQGRGATTEKWLALVDEIDAALAKPARNCDVGTVSEQSMRFQKFCHLVRTRSCDCSDDCPLIDEPDIIHCEFAWAQMPHEVKNEGSLRNP